MISNQQKIGFTALIGFLLSLLIHIISICKFDLQQSLPFIWIMHLAVFPPFIFAIITKNQDSKMKVIQQKNPRGGVAALKLMLQKCPFWFKIILAALFVYAMINFILFLSATGGGTPKLVDGNYLLMRRSEIIRTITEEEYHFFQANLLRGFSGHWLVFNAAALAILWPFKKG